MNRAPCELQLRGDDERRALDDLRGRARELARTPHVEHDQRQVRRRPSRPRSR